MDNKNYNLAFVFPGQGSQSVGMLTELAQAYPSVKQTFARASEILGKDLWQLVTNGSAEDLNLTYNTQPAMLTAGVAIWQVWCERSKLRPSWMAGHSLGEYTALVCSEAMLFDDAVALVAERGALMQEAVPAGEGAMAAIIGLQEPQVISVCNKSAQEQVVSAVNFNAPGQVVIAGHATAVERAMIAAKEAGAKRAVKLPVSAPSHCSLMETAATKLAERLQNVSIESPNVTLIHNVDVASHNSPEVIRNALEEQLFKPVRWVDTIKFMHEQGVNKFVECGPGKVLMGLNKRTAKDAEHFTIYDTDTLNKVLEQL